MLVDEEKQAVCAETGRETLAEKTTTERASQESSNSGLHAARRAKNDEFYTRIEDVEAELYHYRDHFQGKTVYLNCDDPRWSAFWRYFALNFQHLGLERLIATHYTGVVAPGEASYAIEILRGRDEDADGKIGVDSGVQMPLQGDGDFRSEECIELLKQSDIVVTNPPFSLFREYVAQLVEHGKQFVILGNMNAITYKEVWPLIQEGRLWLGTWPLGKEQLFGVTPEYQDELRRTKREGSAWRLLDGVVMGRIAMGCWFTNLDHAKRHEELPLWKKYTPEEYPKYDNYDAINVDKVREIPVDYDGAIGVPITFLDKWNPEQFELLGSFNAGWAGEQLGSALTEILMKGKSSMWNGPVVGKKPLYKRVVIRKKVV